jgi:uncharacterized membrane protein
MKMSWFIYAIIAMFAFSVNFLLIKKILNLGIRSEIVLMYIFGISALVILIFSVSTKTTINITGYIFLFILLAAIFAIIGNVFLFKSIGISPNPGYALAVSGVHILLVAIASVFIFKSDFSLVKGLGTILAVVGIILLGWK